MATETANVMPELPPLLPPPRSIEKVDGTTTLSSDVRLSTRDVLPFMRKGMRGIFTAAEIRVVANKKKFIIEVHVVDESEVELSDIPEDVREDAYEMDIIDNLVTIRSASQMGAAWGVQTFADIYMSAGHDTVIPNVKIRDWSATPVRGFFMECTPALEQMRYDEYTSIVDRIARLKCNLLSVELFRQHLSPDPGRSVVKDALLVPVTEEEPPAAQLCTYEWIDPESGDEESREGFPPLIEAQGLSKLITYTVGKGVEFAPAIALPAKSKVIPEVLPDVKGKDATGADAQDICCLTSDTARNAFEKLLDIILAQGFDEPPAYFLLNLNSTPPTDDPRHWCQCDKCKPKAPGALGGGFITWLVETLVAKGVTKVILSQTDPHHAGQLLTDKLVAELTSGDFAEHVLFRLADNEKTEPGASLTHASAAFGSGAGLSGGFTALLDQIRTAVTEQSCGILATSRPDAQSQIAESIAALNSWAGMVTDSAEEAVGYVAEALAPELAEDLSDTVIELGKAAAAADTPIALMRYIVLTQDLPAPGLLDAILQAAEKHGGKDLKKALNTAVKSAESVIPKLDKLLSALTPEADEKADDETPPSPPAYLQSMRGEAAFVKAAANYLLAALPRKDALTAEKLPEDVRKALAEAGKVLKQGMAEIVTHKSRCPAAADLATLSALLV